MTVVSAAAAAVAVVVVVVVVSVNGGERGTPQLKLWGGRGHRGGGGTVMVFDNGCVLVAFNSIPRRVRLAWWGCGGRERGWWRGGWREGELSPIHAPQGIEVGG